MLILSKLSLGMDSIRWCIHFFPSIICHTQLSSCELFFYRTEVSVLLRRRRSSEARFGQTGFSWSCKLNIACYVFKVNFIIIPVYISTTNTACTLFFYKICVGIIDTFPTEQSVILYIIICDLSLKRYWHLPALKLFSVSDHFPAEYFI